MNILRRDKKEEEDGGGNPYSNLEKASVLQEARLFHEAPVNPRKCAIILTKILYIINQGETLGTNEATEAFFAMTKLFQSKDTTLRRLVYLGIKDMSKIANDVIIVTSSLMKDMTGKEDQFRGPAIRALCSITDHSMLQSIERYMKQAIVEKIHSVSSAALVTSLHLSKGSHEVVKKWVNEAQEAVNSDSIMVQYHAVGLLYHMRKNDKLAVTKLVSKLSKHSIRSPYVSCLLIRIASRLMAEEGSGTDSPMFDFIESCTRHKSEMVMYEAAHALVSMKDVSSKELAPAISLLQVFCGSAKPVLKFAAVKTLNQVAMKHPMAVTACNMDLENLITDSNRSIATLAITTLLKTGSESSVDRLMKQISTFMSEISDEFKIVVVEAIRSLSIKYPRKHQVMMTFLSSMLREEGGFEYKKAMVSSIIAIVEDNPEAKEFGLSHLCEFIEDCEHTVLATRILHLLGCEGPRTPNPAKYIRYIYNRVILEDTTVRAAAVTALAKFGAHCEDLLPSIIILLERCLLDTDDEVRDRATFYLNVLQLKQKALYSSYILNGLQVSIVGLEKSLHQYTMEPTSTPFDIKSVPIETLQQSIDHKTAAAVAREFGDVTAKPDKVAATRQDIYAEQLSAVPELSNLVGLFKSSTLPVELTESETEYVVQCVKHTFTNYIVFQFDCTNTLNDQVLDDVRVQIEPPDNFEVVKYIPCPSLPYNKPGTTYTLVKIPENDVAVTGMFGCTLKFVVRDCDPNTGIPDDDGYDDEYLLEDVELTVADHVQKVLKPNFGVAWDELGEENELSDTYALANIKTLNEATKNVIKFMGMQPCERSEKVPDDKSSHTLYLAGVFRGGHDCLVRCKMALSDGGVTMQLNVRSTDPNSSEILASAIS